MPDSTHGSRPARPLWLVIAVLLGIAIVVPLLVPVYDQAEPTLLGFPFFFWFQFLLIPIASLLTYVAFRISQTATARDRKAHGQSPTPPAAGEPR